jgi:hypothetical protein
MGRWRAVQTGIGGGRFKPRLNADATKPVVTGFQQVNITAHGKHID